MLGGLRHDPVVCGNDQEREIDPCRTGEHIVDEALVPRHVDEAQHRTIWRRQIGKPQIDRDASRLFFFQTVGINAGERPYQRGLSVIDVTGRSYDHASTSDGGVVARCCASAISALESAARAGPRKAAASAL